MRSGGGVERAMHTAEAIPSVSGSRVVATATDMKVQCTAREQCAQDRCCVGRIVDALMKPNVRS